METWMEESMSEKKGMTTMVFELKLMDLSLAGGIAGRFDQRPKSPKARIEHSAVPVYNDTSTHQWHRDRYRHSLNGHNEDSSDVLVLHVM